MIYDHLVIWKIIISTFQLLTGIFAYLIIWTCAIGLCTDFPFEYEAKERELNFDTHQLENGWCWGGGGGFKTPVVNASCFLKVKGVI